MIMMLTPVRKMRHHAACGVLCVLALLQACGGGGGGSGYPECTVICSEAIPANSLARIVFERWSGAA